MDIKKGMIVKAKHNLRDIRNKADSDLAVTNNMVRCEGKKLKVDRIIKDTTIRIEAISESQLQYYWYDLNMLNFFKLNYREE